MEIISLNCNKLKIIKKITLRVLESMLWGGGGGLFSFFHSKRGLIREGSFFEMGTNRENTVCNE